MCTGYITVKNLFHKVYMARLPLRKTKKTRPGGGPTTKIHFTNSIWRVYHCGKLQKRDPAAALQLRFISQIAYGASTIAENSKNAIRRRPYN